MLFSLSFLVILISARSFSFSREWFAVGRVLGNSIEMRRSIHYALSLGQWFETEATNCDSMENLWSDFQLVLLKLNFVRANLTLQDGRREWQRNRSLDPLTPLVWSDHEFDAGEFFSVRLAMERVAADPTLIYHLAEIAAEAWQKSSASWCARHGLPLRFKSRIGEDSSHKVNQRSRPYVPLVWGRSASLESRQSAAAQPGESA